jgi:hypothetical protein
MTQTATFPNLESLPNVSTQALLYFSAPLGTLTEVDVVTSGTFSTQFRAENLGASSSTITGATSANLTINVPSGPIPLAIPAVHETFNAAAFDGTVNDAGPSGRVFAPIASSSAAQTTVLTSPAALASFTGNFRMPITVSGQAAGSVSSSNGDVSDAFGTQTAVTITITYHYVPNLPSLDPPAPGGSSSPSSASSPSSGAPAAVPSGGATTLVNVPTQHPAAHAKKKIHAAMPAHKLVRHPAVVHHKRTGIHKKN